MSEGISFQQAPESRANRGAKILADIKLKAAQPLEVRNESGVVIGKATLVPDKKNPGGLHIRGVEVDESERGRGYGKKLVDDAIVAAGGGPVSLEVRGDNAVARGLYEKKGFVVQDTVVAKDGTEYLRMQYAPPSAEPAKSESQDVSVVTSNISPREKVWESGLTGQRLKIVDSPKTYIAGELVDLEGTKVAEVDWVTVDESQRGNNVGEGLLREFIDEMRGRGAEKLSEDIKHPGALGNTARVLGKENLEISMKGPDGMPIKISYEEALKVLNTPSNKILNKPSVIVTADIEPAKQEPQGQGREPQSVVDPWTQLSQSPDVVPLAIDASIPVELRPELPDIPTAKVGKEVNGITPVIVESKAGTFSGSIQADANGVRVAHMGYGQVNSENRGAGLAPGLQTEFINTARQQGATKVVAEVITPAMLVNTQKVADASHDNIKYTIKDVASGQLKEISYDEALQLINSGGAPVINTEVELVPIDKPADDNNITINRTNGSEIYGKILDKDGEKIARVDWVEVPKDLRGQNLGEDLLGEFVVKAKEAGAQKLSDNILHLGALGNRVKFFGPENLKISLVEGGPPVSLQEAMDSLKKGFSVFAEADLTKVDVNNIVIRGQEPKQQAAFVKPEEKLEAAVNTRLEVEEAKRAQVPVEKVKALVAEVKIVTEDMIKKMAQAQGSFQVSKAEAARLQVKIDELKAAEALELAKLKDTNSNIGKPDPTIEKLTSERNALESEMRVQTDADRARILEIQKEIDARRQQIEEEVKAASAERAKDPDSPESQMKVKEEEMARKEEAYREAREAATAVLTNIAQRDPDAFGAFMQGFDRTRGRLILEKAARAAQGVEDRFKHLQDEYGPLRKPLDPLTSQVQAFRNRMAELQGQVQTGDAVTKLLSEHEIEALTDGNLREEAAAPVVTQVVEVAQEQYDNRGNPAEGNPAEYAGYDPSYYVAPATADSGAAISTNQRYAQQRVAELRTQGWAPEAINRYVNDNFDYDDVDMTALATQASAGFDPVKFQQANAQQTEAIRTQLATKGTGVQFAPTADDLARENWARSGGRVAPSTPVVEVDQPEPAGNPILNALGRAWGGIKNAVANRERPVIEEPEDPAVIEARKVPIEGPEDPAVIAARKVPIQVPLTPQEIAARAVPIQEADGTVRQPIVENAEEAVDESETTETTEIVDEGESTPVITGKGQAAAPRGTITAPVPDQNADGGTKVKNYDDPGRTAVLTPEISTTNNGTQTKGKDSPQSGGIDEPFTPPAPEAPPTPTPPPTPPPAPTPFDLGDALKIAPDGKEFNPANRKTIEGLLDVIERGGEAEKLPSDIMRSYPDLVNMLGNGQISEGTAKSLINRLESQVGSIEERNVGEKTGERPVVDTSLSYNRNDQ